MPLGKNPLVVKEFKGKLLTDLDQTDFFFGFGEARQIEIPFEYALESVNLEYLKKGGLRTRSGINRYVFHNAQVERPMQMWKIDNLNGLQQTDRWLFLTWDGVTGRMYDTQPGALVNPIMTLAGMKYAYVLNAFGRMYITPWEGWATPLGDAAGGGANNWIWLYNNLYNARLAGCAPLAPGALAVAAIAGGNCTPGLHLVSLIYETDSGARSRPDTAHITAPLQVTTTAANATINITNMPVAPAGSGIITKHIIISKVVVNYNNQGFLSYEPFIVKSVTNATVNTTYGAAGGEGPDSGFVDSAKDWVLSQDIIRSCVSLAIYGNRMVYLGFRKTGGATGNNEPNNDMIAVSRPDLPEQVNFPGLTLGLAPRNLLVIGQDYSGKVMAGGELNGTFYVFKEDSTFGFVADDEKDPVEWPKPALIDGAKGAFPFGVAKVGNNVGINYDGAILVAGNHGVTYFDGRFAQRSLAEGIWDEYDITALRWTKILIEPIRQLIFLRFGDPDSLILDEHHQVNNKIFVGNYYYGIDITSIRWGSWKYELGYGDSVIVSIPDIDLRLPGTLGNDGAVGTQFNTPYSLLCIMGRLEVAPNLWNFRIYSESRQGSDFEGEAYSEYPSWIYETGYTPNKSGELYTFGPMKIRARSGIGMPPTTILQIDKASMDSILYDTVIQLGVAANPARYYSINLNHYGERVRLRLSGLNRMTIEELILEMKETSEDRTRQ